MSGIHAMPGGDPGCFASWLDGDECNFARGIDAGHVGRRTADLFHEDRRDADNRLDELACRSDGSRASTLPGLLQPFAHNKPARKARPREELGSHGVSRPLRRRSRSLDPCTDRGP